MWYAQDGRLYLVPADGNVVAIEAAKDNAGFWDLSNVKGPPRQVRQIIPVQLPQSERAGCAG